MGRTINSKKWIKLFAIGVAIFIAMASAIVYIIDPYFQYRTRDNRYFLNERFVSAGLVKNYDYNTLIIGSSMTQNFNMDKFRKSMKGVKPLHIGIGGMETSEMIEIVELAEDFNKADTYYLCMDISGFTSEDKSELYKYLLRDDIISKLRYSLSYEAWTRFMPIDIILSSAKELEVPLPQKFVKKMSIDDLGNWNDDYKFGKDIVLKNYSSSAFSVSEVDNTNLLKRMETNADKFLDGLQIKNKDVNLFFPPYSALFWVNAQEKGYFEDYLKFKEYLVEKATLRGYNVFDFQSADFTMDLDNYKDTTHYKQEINDWMVECFANLEYKVDTSSVNEYENKLRENTDTFSQLYQK